MTTNAHSATAGRVIGSYPTYAEAQRVVDMLADRGFQVEHVTIIGQGVRLVEKVLGRLTTWRAALAGMATGAWFGLLIGIIFWVVSPWALVAVLWGVLFGALWGAIWGALAHAMTGGRRDFASVSVLDAAAYDVVVDAEHADEAMRVLRSAESTARSTAKVGAGEATQSLGHGAVRHPQDH